MSEEKGDAQWVQTQQIIADIQATLQLRNALQLRVAKRVTTLLRAGLVSLALVAVILLFLLVSLSRHTNDVIAIVTTMNERFVNMSDNMQIMREHIQSMEKSVSAMPVITHEVDTMGKTVTAMSLDLHTMENRLYDMQRDVAGMRQNMGHMTWTFGQLDRGVQGMGADVHRMSRPMKAFNSMSPLP